MGVCSRARLQPSELAPAIVDSVATGPDATRDRPNNKLLKRVLKREDSDADVNDEDWVKQLAVSTSNAFEAMRLSSPDPNDASTVESWLGRFA